MNLLSFSTPLRSQPTMKRMGEPLKQGRPMHVSWQGFDKVYNSMGRVSAKCHICLEVLANTGRLRLENHRAYCQEIHNGGGGVSVGASWELGMGF